MKISCYGLCDMLLFYLFIIHFDKRQIETKVNEYAASCLSNLQLQMIWYVKWYMYMQQTFGTNRWHLRLHCEFVTKPEEIFS